MKKFALFSLLALTLSIASATPPIEGDVLDGNDFVLGVDITAAGIGKKGNVNAPYLFSPNLISGQRITLPTYTKADKIYSDQIDAILNINARYGIFDYVEVFGNANGYFQSANQDFADGHKSDINFANANVGLMVTLYKGDAFRIIIGDNSDIISNTIFDSSSSNMQFFKGHTFFLNLIRRKADDNKLASFTGQIYYRLNLEQSYKDFKIKNGDELGFHLLWQAGKDKYLGFFQGTVALRDSDKINGIKYNGDGLKQNMLSIGTGFSLGTKYDFNDHLGMKISFDFMSYSLDYNAWNSGITFGLYFK